MPFEQRFITFDLEEIYKALSIGCIKENLDPLPQEQLTALKIEEDNADSQKIIFLSVKMEDGEEKELEFERTQFAVSLIFYCQGLGIPLPAQGKKALKIMPDHIIMKIELGG